MDTYNDFDYEWDEQYYGTGPTQPPKNNGSLIALLLMLLIFLTGIVTVLETARSMPQNQRNKVAFILFDLEEKGRRVTIVELGGPLVEKADMSANMKLGLKERLNKAHIQIHTNAKMIDILSREVVIETATSIFSIECDNVILASGFRATHKLEEALQGKPYQVFPIGDAVKPGKVFEAVHGGFHAIRKLNKYADEL